MRFCNTIASAESARSSTRAPHLPPRDAHARLARVTDGSQGAHGAGRALSDGRRVSQSRLVALASTVPLALTGALSLYVATRGSGRGDALPWGIALASALVLLAVRAQQRHEGQVFVEAGGLRVRTLFG